MPESESQPGVEVPVEESRTFYEDFVEPGVSQVMGHVRYLFNSPFESFESGFVKLDDVLSLFDSLNDDEFGSEDFMASFLLLKNRFHEFHEFYERQRALAQQFEDAFWSGGSLDKLYDDTGADPKDALSVVFVAAMREWRRANSRGLADTERADLRASLVSRIDRSMTFTITREMERMERGMNFLASIGSVSPFVGLLGTVWGIMSSFQSIAESKNTSLAVVAPGIAEALFATALGLAAAIPAVVAYNKFAGDLERFGARLETFAQEFSTLLARQLDEGGQ